MLGHFGAAFYLQSGLEFGDGARCRPLFADPPHGKFLQGLQATLGSSWGPRDRNRMCVILNTNPFYSAPNINKVG